VIATKDIREVIERGYCGTPNTKLNPEELLAFIEVCPDNDRNSQMYAELAHAAALGLYFYCSHYHGGQNSIEYSVLSRLTRPGLFNIGCIRTLHADEDQDAIAIYEALGGEWDDDGEDDEDDEDDD